MGLERMIGYTINNGSDSIRMRTKQSTNSSKSENDLN